MRRRKWSTFVLGGGIVVFLSALIVYYFAFTVRNSRGWSFTVLPGTFEKVDCLAFGPDGSLYVTVGRSHAGKIVRIISGKMETLMEGLYRPHGLYYRDDHIYVTEERGNDGRVLRFSLKNRETTVLARLNRPEGIYVDVDGSIVVVEDAPSSRMMRIDKSGAIQILADQLDYGEGLVVDNQGKIYVAEAKKGRVLRIQNGVREVLIDNLTEPDHIQLGPDGAIWITEDTYLGRLLRYKDGVLEVVARGLRFPQGMVFDVQGKLLVADHDRNRILVFQRL